MFQKAFGLYCFVDGTGNGSACTRYSGFLNAASRWEVLIPMGLCTVIQMCECKYLICCVIFTEDISVLLTANIFKTPVPDLGPGHFKTGQKYAGM